jgi:hypothetical protein
LAPGTIRNIHRLIHHALHDALRWGLVVVNVSDAVDPPRVVKQEMRALTAEQAEQFLLQTEGDPLLDTYSHVLPSMLESAVEVLDPLLAKHANKLSDTLSN